RGSGGHDRRNSVRSALYRYGFDGPVVLRGGLAFHHSFAARGAGDGVSDMKATISIRSVSKCYAGAESWAVRGVSLSIFPGEVTVLMGPSGSGKTTLLSMIGGVLSQSEGEINVCGVDLERCDDKQLQSFRRTKVGFIFQSFNLLSSLTAREN